MLTQEACNEKVATLMMKEFSYKSVMEVPVLSKVTLNMGLGEAVADKKILEHAQKDMALISGQKPIVTMARKSVAGFKVRKGWPIGMKVTLRRRLMYAFLDRLVHVALPRIRDFRGLSPRALDGRGNLSIGISEQIIFPEIDYDSIDTLRGLDVAITTTAKNNDEALVFFKTLGFPFRS